MDPIRAHPLALPVPQPSERSVAPSASGGTPFSERLLQALDESNRTLEEAERSSEQIAAGKGDIVETMVSLSRAEVSLRLVVALRNRLLDAYQQIMRMQL